MPHSCPATTSRTSSLKRFSVDSLPSWITTSSRMRRTLARRVKLRYSPEIVFRVDTSFGEAERIDQLLKSPEVSRDLDRDDD